MAEKAAAKKKAPAKKRSSPRKAKGLSHEDLIPKAPEAKAPRGVRAFTVCRQHDETGVSGEGVVVEGVLFATGQCVIHWLTPVPRGSLSIFDSIQDFISVHITPHPAK